MHVLVTGVAGFIGAQVGKQLLGAGHEVIGVDNLNAYYAIKLKEWRLNQLKGIKFYKIDIEDFVSLKSIFGDTKFDVVVHLAARVGVRHSIAVPYEYMKTNITGTLNLLELCRAFSVPKFILASSSSLYAGQNVPFKEDAPLADSPISPYAASKRAAEVVVYTYHKFYGIDISVLRYFTVYGPAGRPDMSPFRFIKWIMNGSVVQVFGDGSQARDFTYIDDIVTGTLKALKRVGYEIINLGTNKAHELRETIKIMEKYIGKKAKIIYRDFHKVDLKSTCADINKARRILNWSPIVGLEEGLKRTVDWFKENWDWVKELES